MGAKKLKPEQLQAVRMMTTGDETWVHHYQLETKQASRQWKHKESPTPTKFKVVPAGRANDDNG